MPKPASISQPTSADTQRHLNVALKYTLTAINQHFLHARMLKHQGQMPLADREYRESIDTMRHADRLVERILDLGGLPNLQELASLSIGHTPPEMLRANLVLEQQAVKDLDAAVASAAETGDEASGSVLAAVRKSAGERVQFLEQQLQLLERK